MNFNYQILSNNIAPESGSVLISEPLLKDSYFKRSVVLLIEHAEKEGTVGVILNKPLEVDFNTIVQDSPFIETQMFLGGPVQMSNVYFIHNKGNLIENSLQINENLFWGGNIEVVNELIRKKILTKNNIRFFIGYSGWESGQLQSEILKNSWAVYTPPKLDIFNMNPVIFWNQMVKCLGPDYRFWMSLPDDPELN